MAFQADFFVLTKKRNSTLQPSGTGHYSLSVTLNDSDTSLLSPSLRLRIPSDGILLCNYVHIIKFSRYYWINDWTYNADGTWTASCSVDAMASWKTQIFASGGYVGRASTTVLADSNIIDSMYPATRFQKVVNDAASTGFPWTPGNGLYVIGVISSESPNVGVVSYYMVTHSEMAKLLAKMTTVTGSDTDWSNIDTITGDVLKSIVNPMQYIVSAKWFPETRTVGNEDAIRLWGWDTTAGGTRITNANVVGTKTIDISLSDVSVGAGDAYKNFPRYAPYAQYSLITAWGTFDLDPNVMSNYRYIQIVFTINHISGTATIVGQIPDAGSPGSRIELFRKQVQFALDIPLAQISTDYVNMAKTAVNGVAAAANVGGWISNPGGNAAAIVNSSIDAAVYALSPSVQSSAGSGGMFSPEISTVTVQQIRYATFSTDDNDFGKPVKRHFVSLNAFRYIEGVSTGYVQMDYSNFTAPCTPQEQNEIISTLESGAFLE